MVKKIEFHNFEGEVFDVDSDKVTYRPSVYGILIEDNKILLSKQWDGYDMPGGGAKIHETIEEALRREFFEETGLEIEVLQPVHCETTFYNPTHTERKKDLYWNCPMMYFLVKKLGGELSDSNLDNDELEYAEMPEWVSLDIVEDTKFINSVDSNMIIEKAKHAIKLYNN